MDVVPQDELVEGEGADDGLLHDVPSIHVHDLPTEGAEDPGDIDAAFIRRQRVQSADRNALLLTEIFEEGDVEQGFLVATVDDVAAGGGLAGDFDRKQENRGVARLHALGRLIILQQAEGEEQRIRTVLFHVGPRFPIQMGKCILHPELVQIGSDTGILQFLLHDAIDRIGGIHGLMETIDHPRTVPVRRTCKHMEILVSGEFILQLVDMDGDDLERILGQADAQQVVPHGEVEQFPLPGGLPVHDDLPVLVGLVRLAQVFRPAVGVHGFTLVYDDPIPIRSLHAHRKRTDMPLPSPENVEEKKELLRVELLFGDGTGLLESRRVAGIHTSTLHDENLVDAAGHPLRQQGRIVIDAVRKGVFHQPAAGEGVAPGEDDEGMQPHRLQTAGIQHRHIQAGSEMRTQHLVHQADPLAGRLEAGRDGRVFDSLGLDRVEQRRHHLHHPVRILRLILVQGGTSRPFAQQFRRGRDDAGHSRMVGRREGRQHPGQHRGAAPFVEGQDGHLVDTLESRAVRRNGFQPHGPHETFRDIRQIQRREPEGRIRHDLLVTGIDPVDVHLKLFRKTGFERDADGNVMERSFAVIQELDLPDDVHPVLLHG